MLRSTAPVITSPLEAWPARPSPRTSPIKREMPGLDSGVRDVIPAFGSSMETSTAAMIYDRSTTSGPGAPTPGSSTRSSGSTSTKVVTPPPRLRLVKGTFPDDHSPGIEGDDANPHPYDSTVIQYGRRGDEEESSVGSSKRYGPPRRPLTPNQLGRIAQSFGIVIPSLPIPSPTALSLSPLQPSTSRTRSPHTMTQAGKGSGWLLTVIPPYSILLPLANAGPISPRNRTHRPVFEYDDGNAEDGGGGMGGNRMMTAKERDRRRRWKRGRLLPLQPTMGSMLLCIAREYGLPSTQGINLYLVHQPPSTHLSAPSTSHHSHSTSISSAISSSSFGEEASGPQISAQTWTTLFAGYVLQSAASSRASTPNHTPVHPSGLLGRDVPFPASPLSMTHQQKGSQKPGQKAESSFGDSTSAQHAKELRDALSPSASSTSSLASGALSASTSSRLPPTPVSNSNSSSHLASFLNNPPTPVNPIVGSIEFDVDESAGWYDDWRRRSRGRHGHARKVSSISDSGWTGESSNRRRLDSLAESAISSGTTAHSISSSSGASGGSGVRQLKLVRKLQDANDQARFLRELDSNRRGSVPSLPIMDKPRSMSASHADDHRPELRSENGAESSSSVTASTTWELESGSKGIDVSGGSQVTLVEMDGALVGLSEPNIHLPPDTHVHGLGMGVVLQDVSGSAGAEGDELLASPIALDKTHLDRVLEVVQEVRDGMEKRGSGLVMSDELDRLEQSESTLYPRTGCSVADTPALLPCSDEDPLSPRHPHHLPTPTHASNGSQDHSCKDPRGQSVPAPDSNAKHHTRSGPASAKW